MRLDELKKQPLLDVLAWLVVEQTSDDAGDRLLSCQSLVGSSSSSVKWSRQRKLLEGLSDALFGLDRHPAAESDYGSIDLERVVQLWNAPP